MWPDHGEALSHTIAAEGAVEGLYEEALRRWLPVAEPFVLPSLTAATYSTLPADPAAVQQTQPQWDATAETVIVAGIGLLWAATLFDTLGALGLPLPSLSDLVLPVVDLGALRIVDGAVGDMGRQEVLIAAAAVEADPVFRQQRDDHLTAQRDEAQKIPGQVQAKIEMAVRDHTGPAEPGFQREVAREVMQPGSIQTREIAKVAGYQAAGVQNAAVVAAAAGSDDELDKVWIATLDGKTRPTHWAADGQRTPLASTFSVGGDHLRFPGDPTGSPGETINCRCRVGILARDEELPDEVDRHTERLNGRDSTARNREGRSQAEEIRRRAGEGQVRAREDPDGIGRTAAGGFTAPSEEIDTMTAPAMQEQTTTLVEGSDDGAQSDGDTYLTFTDALFAVAGVPTSDGRMLAADIDLTFRDTPMPLQWCEKSEGGHNGSVTVGVIESITFADGEVRGSGYMLNNDNALKAIDLVSHGVCNPSLDFVAAMAATYEDGTLVTEENYDSERQIFETFTKGEVLATTIVSIPAFGQTRFSLNEQREHRDKALVASAAAEFRPRVYDPALFADPKLSGPTLLTLTEDGHVFGHIACFGECHRSIQSECIMAPRSNTGYRHFHSSPGVHLSDGTVLAVGRLTVGTGHAPDNLAAGPAMEHYDNTGSCFAIVRAGEDQHGIWVSGVTAPWATAEQIEMGLSSPLSGDWRRLDGNLELVAALAVNTPGFLARGITGADGVPTTLVASLAPSPDTESGRVAHLSLSDIKAAMREAIAEERRHSALVADRDAALERARSLVGDPPPPLTAAEQVNRLLDLHANPSIVFADPNPGRGMPAQFKKYWLPGGVGGTAIAWGTPGDFNRCVKLINAKIVEHGKTPLPDHEIKGLCAKLHKEATGATPGHAPGEGG